MIDGSESPNTNQSFDSGSRDHAAVREIAFHQCVPGSIIIFIIVIVIIIIIFILNMELVVLHHIQAKCSERLHPGQPESCSV